MDIDVNEGKMMRLEMDEIDGIDWAVRGVELKEME